MNNTFLLSFAVTLIAGLGALALLGACLMLVTRHRALAGQLLLAATPAGALGVGGLYGVASLTNTAPSLNAAGIAFLCGAGVAALAWSLFRSIMRQEPGNHGP